MATWVTVGRHAYNVDTVSKVTQSAGGKYSFYVGDAPMTVESEAVEAVVEALQRQGLMLPEPGSGFKVRGGRGRGA